MKTCHIAFDGAARVRALGAAALGAAVFLSLAGCASRSGGSPVAAAPAAQPVPSAPAAPPAPAPSAAAPQAPAPPPEAPYAVLPPLEGEGWQSLFDGQTLTGWKATEFAGHGEVKVENGQLLLEMGATLTGVNGPTNIFPTLNYEITLDAMKVSGGDFFCGLTVPVGAACCTLIVGGWGGTVVGISSIDGMDASENATTKFLSFDSKKWYRVRLRVTKAKLEAWIGRQKVVDQELEGRRIGMRPGEIELNQPFGVATYQTTAALRGIRWRPI